MQAGRCKLSLAKSRLRGSKKSLVGNGLKPFPTQVRRNQPAPCFDTGKDEGAVATGKEQLLARPREGERAGNAADGPFSATY